MSGIDRHKTPHLVEAHQEDGFQGMEREGEIDGK